MSYVNDLCTKWNRQFADCDTEEERESLYQQLVQTTKDKIVPGWKLVTWDERKKDWVYERYYDPITSSKKEKTMAYPATTGSSSESDTEEATGKESTAFKPLPNVLPIQQVFTPLSSENSTASRSDLDHCNKIFQLTSSTKEQSSSAADKTFDPSSDHQVNSDMEANKTTEPTDLSGILIPGTPDMVFNEELTREVSLEELQLKKQKEESAKEQQKECRSDGKSFRRPEPVQVSLRSSEEIESSSQNSQFNEAIDQPNGKKPKPVIVSSESMLNKEVKDTMDEGECVSPLKSQSSVSYML